MTRMKKFVSIVLAVALLTTSFAVTSFASDGGCAQPTDGVLLRAALCADCGIGQMVMKPISYSSWYTVDRTPCTHNVPNSFWCWDEVQERTITRCYACTYCGVTSNLNVSTEQRIVHHDG